MRTLVRATREEESGAARACVTVCRRVGDAGGWIFVDFGVVRAGMDSASRRAGEQPVLWRAR